MTCIVCKTSFFGQSWSSPAESCDCGTCVTAEGYRHASEDEQHVIERAMKAWPVACLNCLETTGEIVAGTKEPHEADYRCDNCRTNDAEAAHERMLSDYYGGNGPVTMQEHYDAAAKLDRSQR